MTTHFHRAWQSRPPDGELDRRPAPAVDRTDFRPSDIRWLRCGFRQSQLRSSLVEMLRAAPRCRRCSEEPDHRHGRLLRVRSDWPRGGRAAEHQDELAPPHSITSSARASSVGGTSRPSILAVWALMTSSNLVDCTTGRSNVHNIAQRKPPSMLDRMPIAFAIMGRRQPRVACWRARRGRTKAVLHFVGGIRNRTCRSPP